MSAAFGSHADPMPGSLHAVREEKPEVYQNRHQAVALPLSAQETQLKLDDIAHIVHRLWVLFDYLGTKILSGIIQPPLRQAQWLARYLLALQYWQTAEWGCHLRVDPGLCSWPPPHVVASSHGPESAVLHW